MLILEINRVKFKKCLIFLLIKLFLPRNNKTNLLSDNNKKTILKINQLNKLLSNNIRFHNKCNNNRSFKDNKLKDNKMLLFKIIWFSLKEYNIMWVILFQTKDKVYKFLHFNKKKRLWIIINLNFLIKLETLRKN
jgi:hypothetical protein